MMHAYDFNYLDDAMRNLGEAFDYAVNVCNIEIDKYYELFVSNEIAEAFGKGTAKYVAGMSGMDLVFNIIDKTDIESIVLKDYIIYDYSCEYWCGWILAYYQWYTGESFKQIKNYLSIGEIKNLYPTMHEVSDDKVIDVIVQLVRSKKTQTHLQVYRKMLGYSQKELAKKSGVSLRMIQQYEQRAKDINKATGMNLILLANALGCKMEDLMEHNYN